VQLLGQQFPLTHIPLHAFPPPSVLWELHGAIDFNGKFMCSSNEFSEGSFKVIMYGKLLRFDDIYRVSAQSSLQRTNVHWPRYCLICYITTLFLGQHFTYDAASTLD